MPKGDGCNNGCTCYGGKIECSTRMRCGTLKDCILEERVVIRHLTVWKRKSLRSPRGDYDSCNTCDCFDGKISCTNKECAVPEQPCKPSNRCQNDNQCGANGKCNFT